MTRSLMLQPCSYICKQNASTPERRIPLITCQSLLRFVPMAAMMSKLAHHLKQYYSCLLYFTFRNGTLKNCPYFAELPEAQVQLFSIAVTLRHLHSPHYRAPTFRHDIAANLSNIAFPGTGIKASLFFLNSITAWLFFILVVPILATVSALYTALLQSKFHDLPDLFAQHLLDPQSTWFGIWRLNCVVVAWHGMLTHGQQYEHEDKGTFLLRGEQQSLPISPFLDLPGLVVKHKSIEGGMGLHFYNNFTEGGDWILQLPLKNSPFLASLLPTTAPLSTLRVITSSRSWLHTIPGSSRSSQTSGGRSKQANGVTTNPDYPSGRNGIQPEVVTVVLRAGRAGASTDHNSICFEVDAATGAIGPGRTNQHWYQVGWSGPARVWKELARSQSGAPQACEWTHHPDSNTQIAGRVIPNFHADVIGVCTQAHASLLPHVPLVGWDVALTDQGPCLLELNISCNFFLGSYHRDGYIAFVKDFFLAMEECEGSGGSGHGGRSGSAKQD